MSFLDTFWRKDAEIDALVRDAARYRWIKATNGEAFRDELEGDKEAIAPLMVNDGPCAAVALSPDEMDDAIDVAMERWPQ